MPNQKIQAWLVHLYTASGGVLGMFALFNAAEGKTRTAFLLLVLSQIIDATDGMLARRVQVRRVLPHFSGAQVDDMVDTLTFIWVAIFIMWAEKLVPHPAWTIIPILAGLYAYGQVNMKTDDNFFLGFPSYWSTIALYMYWLRPAPLPAILMVVVPAILSFIPTRYLYPSKSQVHWKPMWVLGAVWFLMVIYLLFQEAPSEELVWLSLFYPAYYFAASLYFEFKLSRMVTVTV